jgi:hypothetical protein
MTLPSVSIKKQDGQTGAVGTSPLGILAIIAPAASGSFNAPSAYTVDSNVFTDYGPSPLADDSSYTLNVAGNPVIPIRPTTATAAAYGALTKAIVGTCVPTAGAAVPSDDYPVVITIVDPGTVGVAGITYTYSLDGGNSTSGKVALGTSSTLTIPNFGQGGSPGVSFALAAGTLLAGDTWSCPVTSARSNDSDLATSLEALRTTTLPWEGVLVDQDIGTGTTGLVDTWLAGLEAVGQFRFAVLGARLKNQATPESETAYATAMTTLVNGSAPSIRMCVTADGGKISSTLTGLLLTRKASLFLAADAMSIPIGQDPAWVDAGPLTGVSIAAANGNPAFHNELFYPNLDQLLLSTLRTFHGESPNAIYLTNANVFSTVGSDYVFLPHIRTMNRACELAYKTLKGALGRGVGKKPKDPTTGGVYMLDTDRISIESRVNAAVRPELMPPGGTPQVAGFQFVMNKTDDIGANSGAKVSGSMQLAALAYIKKVSVLAVFVKTIAVPVA